MHILLVHQFFLKDGDGGGSRWNEMSRIWTEAGHQVTVLTGTGHYMEVNPGYVSTQLFDIKTNKDGVKVIFCPSSSSWFSGYLRKLIGFIAFTFSAIWGGAFHAKDKYDLIIVSSPPLFVGIAGIMLSLIKRVPFVFEVRDLWPESAIETDVLKNPVLIRLAYWFEAVAYRSASLVNVLTPAFREILINKKSVPPGKIIYIPNAADFSMADEVASVFDANKFRIKNGLQDKFVIVYVGAHGIANHLIQVLETAALLRDTHSLFLMIGDGEQKEMLAREAVMKNLSNVRFLGKMSKSEVFEYILAADMGTSVLKKTEIFKTIYSNKTFDYFSCKKPVLMVIDGVSRKLVEDASAGVFVEPENPADFAEKVRLCIKNREFLLLQGKNGYNYAKVNFDRKVLAMEYLQYLEGLLEKYQINRNGKFQKHSSRKTDCPCCP